MKKLNFGCGTDIKDGFDNVDIQEGEGINKSFDFNVFPYPIKDNTYDYVYHHMVLEHIKDRERTLHELHRICKNGAIIESWVAYWNNKGAWNDMTDQRPFSEVTFQTFVNNTTRHNYKKKFEIVKIYLEPTIVGKFMPRIIRNKLSLFLCGLIGRVRVDMEVIK